MTQKKRIRLSFSKPTHSPCYTCEQTFVMGSPPVDATMIECPCGRKVWKFGEKLGVRRLEFQPPNIAADVFNRGSQNRKGPTHAFGR